MPTIFLNSNSCVFMIRTVILSFVVLTFLTGCVTVSPWQRGTLSKNEMSWSPDALESTLDNHVYFAKEASSGGGAAAGGGCGCN